MPNDEWTVVRRRTRVKKLTRNVSTAVHRNTRKRSVDTDKLNRPFDAHEASEALRKMQEILPSFMESLRSSVWWKRTSQQLREAIGGRRVLELHCLGIGSFADILESLWQFACALLTRDCFGNHAKCTIADPVMGDADRQLASDMGFEVVQTTDITDSSIDTTHIIDFSRPTNRECVLWFMLHCPRKLYECVLSKCETTGYNGMVFFANKLSNYIDEEDQETTCPLLKRMCKDAGFRERDCPNSELSPRELAFNDLSIIATTTVQGGGTRKPFVPELR